MVSKYVVRVLVGSSLISDFFADVRAEDSDFSIFGLGALDMVYIGS